MGKRQWSCNKIVEFSNGEIRGTCLASPGGFGGGVAIGGRGGGYSGGGAEHAGVNKGDGKATVTLKH